MASRTTYYDSFKIKIDYSELNEAKKALTKYESTLLQVVDRDQYKDMVKGFKAVAAETQKLTKLKEIRETVKALGNTKAARELLAKLKKEIKQAEKGKTKTVGEYEDAKGKLLDYGKNQLAKYGKQAFDSIVAYFKSAITEAINEIKNMTSFYSGGLFYSTSAREQQMNYGLSDAENYALTKAMDYLGFNNIDDLWMMNDTQQAKFAELTDKYANEYQEKVNSGFYDKMSDLQMELKDLKEELTYELIDWIAANKDDIIDFIKIGFEFMKLGTKVFMGLLEALAWMLNMKSSQNTSDIISNYVTNSPSNTNVQVTNNINAVNPADATSLAKATNQMNRPLIEFFNQ